MREISIALGLLFLAGPTWAATPEGSGQCPSASRVAEKRDPEVGPLKGKVDDGLWQRMRWEEKSVEARKEVRLERLREPEVRIPDRF